MSTPEMRQTASPDRDDRRVREASIASRSEVDRADTLLVIEDLDHPAPAAPAYTFCG